MTTVYRPLAGMISNQHPAALAPRSSGGYNRIGHLAKDAFGSRPSVHLLRSNHSASAFAKNFAR